MDVGEVRARLTADASDMQAKFDDMRQRLAALGASAQQAGKQAAGSFDGLNQSVDEAESKLGGLSKYLSSAAFIAGGAALTYGLTVPLIQGAKQAILTADDYRRTETAFTTMFHSAEKASAFLGDLKAFAAATPFTFPDLVEASKRMLALGFNADQIIPSLRNIGDAVSGLGGNASVFQRIILALGQMQAKGTVASQEMRQLAEAGIPAWDILAKAIGVTVPEAMEQVRKGSVDAAFAIEAIMAGMGERFGGLMEQQSKTIQGQMANIQDTITFTMMEVGKSISESLDLPGVVAKIAAFAKEFLEWFKQLDAGTKKTALIFAATFAATGPILVVVGAFMALIAAGFGPLMLGGALIAGLIAGIASVVANWETIKKKAASIWEAMTQTVAETVAAQKEVWIQGWKNLRDSVVGLAKGLYDGVKQWLGDKMAAIMEPVNKLTSGIVAAFRYMKGDVVEHSSVPDMVNQIGKHMQRLDKEMLAPVLSTTRSSAQAFARTSDGVVKFSKSLTDLYEEATSGSPRLGKLADALQGTLSSFGQLAGAISAIGPAWQAVQALIAANPYVAAGLAIAAFALLVYENWDKIKLYTQKMVEMVKVWIDKLIDVFSPVKRTLENVVHWFADMRDKIVGHSEVPEMVEEIADHMNQLDVRMGSAARVATSNTLRAFRTLGTDVVPLVDQVVNVMVSAWGNVTNSVSNALAQNIVEGHKWAQTWRSITTSVLSAFINFGIQYLTQQAIIMGRAIVMAGQQNEAHTAMEGAKTAATIAGEASRLAIVSANNALLVGAMMSVLGAVSAIGQAVLTVAAAVSSAVAGILYAAATAAAIIPGGQPIAGALIAAATALEFGTAVAITAAEGVIQAAIGAAIVAATTASLPLPGAQEGGIITRPTILQAGEKGPEAIIPLDRYGMGGPVTIQVVVGSRQVAEEVFKQLPRYGRLITGAT